MSDKWKEAAAQILVSLDLRAEYASLGLRIATSKPRATGWLPCHAMGRPDKTPSAEINVGDGPARGRYRDFGDGGGESISFFDFCAKHGPYKDWKEARDHFATKTDTKLPKSDEAGRPADKFGFYEMSGAAKLTWCRKMAGIEPRAVDQVGISAANWPKTAPERLRQTLMTAPMFGHAGLELDPVGFHSLPVVGRHIRKFAGKGNEPEMIRTMTLGSPGLMNVWGLRYLPEAEVVWLTEGLSDLLALQTALDDRTDHIVLSCGGASYHLPEDCRHFFENKDVRIVYDNDQAGRDGAKVQVGRLVDVAAAVRNVILPKEVKDLRDWLVAGNEYQDLWQYSRTFDVILPADKTAQLQPHQALLKNLGVIVSGQLDGTESVEIYSQDLHKITLIRDINRFSYETAILAIGDKVEELISDAEKDPIPTKQPLKNLKRALVKEGGRRQLSSNPAVGCGIWPVGEYLVLAGPRHADVYTPTGELEQVETPAVREQRLTFAGDPWYNRAELQRYLQQVDTNDWAIDAFNEATSLFARWDNWVQPTTPQLLAALAVATWIQTLWDFRPLVSIVGPTSCGKTMLLEETLPPMFSGLGFYCVKPTEAGLRQSVGTTGKVVIIDEFEKCDHRPKILELLRTSSRGAQIPRGGSGTRGPTMYGLRHIAWVGAIEINMARRADANRFIEFDLGPISPGPPKLRLPPKPELQDLGLRLLAFALKRHRRLLERADVIKRMNVEADSRLLELYSVPTSVIAEVFDFSPVDTEGFLRAVLAAQDRGGEEESDEARLVRDILEAEIFMPRGRRETASSLIRGTTPIEDNDGQLLDREEQLAIRGVRVVRDVGKPMRIFFAKDPVNRRLLHDTKWKDTDISAILARIPAAKRMSCRIQGHSTWGVMIPMESLADLVGLELRPEVF